MRDDRGAATRAPERLAIISRLFSSTVIRELAKNGRSPLFVRLARQSNLLDSGSRAQHVFNVFETAFSILEREGCRDEYIYKAALIHKVLLGKHSLQTASMLNEFRVGECKADLAILNGTSTVYEVKSERDSLARLQQQIAAYRKVFAYIYIISGEKHIRTVLATVPPEVGVLRLNNRYQISTVREATDGTDRVSPAVIFESIRTSEAQQILKMYDVTVPLVPNTRLHSVLREHFLKIRPSEAHFGMVQVLKKTRNLMPLAALIAELPFSLQTAALSVPLRKMDHARLVSAVNTSLHDAMSWA